MTICLVVSGCKTSISDASIPDKEIVCDQTAENDSSANAIITITWTTAPTPDK